jgi:transposase
VARPVQKKGLDGLDHLAYRGDPGDLTAAQQQRFVREATDGRFKTAAMAQAFLRDTFDKTFSLSGVRKLLTRLGFSFHKASSFLFKAKRDKQEEFVKDYEQDKPKVESQRWRRYFIDGVHPLYGMEVLYYCWLPIGKRLELGVGGGRKRLNILGAFCPDDHEYLDRRYTDKNLNAQSVIELFERMMERHPETKHFRIYLDNARYQHAKVLMAWIARTKADKGVMFDLKHLPAYSPNLNLIERLWKFMRKEALQTWHENFEKMQEAVARVMDNLPDYEAKLRTLMTERFHLVPEMPTLVVEEPRS